MKKKRIGLFVPSLAGGGAERVILTLAGAFSDCGYDVDLVVVRESGPLIFSVPSGVTIVNLNSSRLITSLPKLVRYFRRARPDAMLSAMSAPNCVAIWARAIARSRTRLVVSEHNNLSNAYKAAEGRRFRLLPALMRASYPMANGVVAVSDGVATDLAATIGLARHDIRTIYNPVVSTRLIELGKESPAHPWFGDGGSPIIVGAGRLVKAKDFPTLLRSFAKVRRERPVRLVILGEGVERQALEALAEELGVQSEVSFPGYFSNPYACMRAASLFVLSSQWEGLSNVLAEAIALGVPVIATDCPSGPAEILEGGRNGALVPVGDAEALSVAILKALSVKREKLKARVEAVEPFLVERVVKHYLDSLVGSTSEIQT